jgi:hypothetical protein
MLFVCKQELERALTGLNRIVPKRPGLPILRYARLQTINPQTVILTATNLEESLSCRIKAADAPEGLDTLLPLAEVKAFIKGDKRSLFKIEAIAAGGVSITEDIGGQDLTQIFPAPVVDDFPQSLPTDPLSDVPDDFVNTLFRIAPSASTDAARKVLQGILMTSEGLTGTDGKQLCHVPYPLPITEDCILRLPQCLFPFSAKVPTRLGIFKHNDITRVTIETGNWIWTGKSPFGTYPNWQQIVPRQQDIAWKAELDKEGIPQLVNILQRLPNDATGNLLRLSIKPDGVELFTDGSDTAIVSCRINTVEGTLPVKPVLLDRNIILRSLSLGHNTIEQPDGVNTPLIATGGMGKLVFMPWRERVQSAASPVPTPTQENTTIEQPKEEHMSKVTPIDPAPPVVPEKTSAPKTIEVPATPVPGLKVVQPADSYDELLESLDELRITIRTLNEQTLAISRKIRESQAGIKKRERDLRTAFDVLDKLKVSGF